MKFLFMNAKSVTITIAKYFFPQWKQVILGIDIKWNENGRLL